MKFLTQKKKTYTTISFIDIAGIVSGASKGEGLGNKFLSNIREVDAIIHMIRCFDSDDIQNVNPSVDPIRDIEIIDTELKLADLESIEKRLDKKNRNKENDIIKNILIKSKSLINSDKNFDEIYEEFSFKELKMSGLLCVKPCLYVCNVDEKSISAGNKYTEKFLKRFDKNKTIIISAEIENQINQLDEKEKNNFMEILNIKDTGLNYLINKGYNLLNLETFFTSGEKESRAWTIKKNCSAPKAAGEIHSDFEKGFIRAETISYEDFIECGGWIESRNKGKMRLEGKEYIVKDGDILNFRFNT